MKLLQTLRELRQRLVPLFKPGRSSPAYYGRNTAGVVVNSDTVMTLSAVWNAVCVISDDVAGFPWHVMRRKPDGSKEHVIGGTVDGLLHTRPNPDMTPLTFRQTLTAHRLLWGNGFAEIERNRRGEPINLWPWQPDRVEVVREGSKLWYVVSTDNGESFSVPGEDVLHIKGLGFDGLLGYSVIAFARQSLGLGMATEQFGASFFKNSIRPGGTVELPGRLTDDARKVLRDEIEGRHRGPGNAGAVMILEHGIKFVGAMIPPNDAQWLETREFQVTEVARWFKIPPHKIADLKRATFSNIAEQNREYAESAIIPIILAWEQEANWKLLDKPDEFTKMNIRALLRANPKEQMEVYTKGIAGGIWSVNEVREWEDMNPIEGGDKHVMQVNMTTLEKIGEDPPAPVTPALPEPDDAGTEDNPAMRAMFADAAGRVIGRDIKAIGSQIRRFKDKEHLETWLVGYFARSRDTIAAQIGLAVRAMTESVGGDAQSVWVDNVIEQLTTQHISRSCSELSEAFDGGDVDSVLEGWKVSRVPAFADQLTESALVAAMLEKSHG